MAPAVDQSNQWAGGGYLSPAEDMVWFGTALRPGFLTSESPSLLFRARTVPTGEPTGCGLGWLVGADRAGHQVAYHGGSSVGGTAILTLHRDDRLVVCILVNSGASRSVNRLSEQLAHLVLRPR